MKVQGSCHCGNITYEADVDPESAHICNCTDCQTASGSAFALNMPVATESLRITQGNPKGWRRPSPSGADVTSWFCADCGGRLYGERKGRPETMNLRAGTLDDTSWLVPVAHMFLRSAQPWVKPASDAECHKIGPGDFRVLAEKWRALWPEFFAAK